MKNNNDNNKVPLNKNNRVPRLRFPEFNDEWTKVCMFDYFNFFSTNSLSWDNLNYELGDIKNLHYGIIHGLSSPIIYNTGLIPFINANFKLNKYTAIKDGDILLADTSEDRYDSGKPCEIVNPNGETIVSGLHTLHLREKEACTIPLFKALYFSSDSYRKYSYKYCEGVKVFSLKSSLFKYFFFAYPDKKEQQKIIKFILLLEKKIEILKYKLAALKKYKRGLEVAIFHTCISITKSVNLEDICTIKTGKLDANEMTPLGKYKFFTCSKKDFLIDKYAFEGESLLISGNGDIGIVKYYNGKFNAYQRTYVLQNFTVHPQYIQLILNNILLKKITRETNIGAMPYIRKSTLESLSIPIIKNQKQYNIAELENELEKSCTNKTKSFKNVEKLKKHLINNLFI